MKTVDLTKTFWRRNQPGLAFHAESKNWIRNSLSRCQLPLKVGDIEIQNPMPGRTKLCSWCLKAIEDEQR